MVIVTHESNDSVSVGTGKQKGLESLSENRSKVSDPTKMLKSLKLAKSISVSDCVVI